MLHADLVNLYHKIQPEYERLTKMTPFETFSNNSAARIISPANQGASAGFGIDWMTILTLVATIAKDLIENCPMAADRLAKSLGNPGLLMKVAALRTARRNCECCGGRYIGLARQVAQAMEEECTSMSETDRLAVITEMQSDNM